MRSRFYFSRAWVLSKGKLPKTSWVLQIAVSFPNSRTPLFALQPGWWLLGLLESSYCFPVLPDLLHPRRSFTVPLAFLQHLEGCCSELYERPGFLVEITLAPLPNPLLFKTVAMDSIKTQRAWTEIFSICCCNSSLLTLSDPWENLVNGVDSLHGRGASAL